MRIRQDINLGLWSAAILASTFITVPAKGAAILITTRQEPAGGSLTPVQMSIEKHRARLNSADEEERRDAVSQLGAMQHPDASRAAIPALKDPSPIVRATAASTILSLPKEDSAMNLLPLLSDKHEFVRRETAYALGKTGSATAVDPLIERLLTDKEDGVRGAAAVALGEIANESAVPRLVSVIGSQEVVVASKKKSRSKKEQNPFVLRAVARSLGQIRSRAGVPALIAVLQNEKAEDDVRREAAVALGLIGDEAAIPALRNSSTSNDPYLAQAAHEALAIILRSDRHKGK